MSDPRETDWTADATRGWSMDLVQPQLSGGASIPAPDFYRRTVAAVSKAHGVSDGEPKQAGVGTPDQRIRATRRMMRAAIPSEPDPWLLLAGEFHASSDVEIADEERA